MQAWQSAAGRGGADDGANDGGLNAGGPAGKRVMAARLAVGLLQGVLLYWLYRSSQQAVWPATVPYAMPPLLLLGLFLPLLLVSSLGHLSWRGAAAWLGAALLVLLAMALHDAWRGQDAHSFLDHWHGQGREQAQGKTVYPPSLILVQFCCVFFFIAHTLVLAGAREGRRLASYGAYFETAWKHGIQLMFSVAFVGALFLSLQIGAQLFLLIKLDFLSKLLAESWFNVPVICCAFSIALHITDVRPAIVRGIRTLALVLLSWILPVAVLIVGGFLCSLPFTGLQALWHTRHATSVLLGACALLIVLINAAFQNGEVAGVAAPLRASARAGAILILPLTAIGVYALGLRVGDYGWTTERIIAAACLLVAACYALGYAWAACRFDSWLRPIASVNVAAAYLVLAVLFALFTPIADPARIAVSDQMARLASGKTKAADVDFHYLRFEGGRYGKAALESLRDGATGPDAALLKREAALALAMTSADRWTPPKRYTAPVAVAANLQVWPAGAQLPASLLAQKWETVADRDKPACLSKSDSKCDAFIVDMNGDGKPEVLLADTAEYQRVYLLVETDGVWRVGGHMEFTYARCKPLLEKLKHGDFRVVEPRLRELEVAGQRIVFNPVFPFDGDACQAIK